MTTGRLNNDGNRRPGTRPLSNTGPLRPPAPPPPPPPPVRAQPPAGRPAPQAADADGVTRRRMSMEDLPDVNVEGVKAPSREQRQASAPAAAKGFDLSAMVGSLIGQGQALNTQAHAQEGQLYNQAIDRVGGALNAGLSALGFSEAGQGAEKALDAAGDVAEAGSGLFGMVENAALGLVGGLIEGAVDRAENVAGTVVEGASRTAGIAGDMIDAAQTSAAKGGDLGDMLSAAGTTGAREAQAQLVAPAVAGLEAQVAGAARTLDGWRQTAVSLAEGTAAIAGQGLEEAQASADAGGSIGDQVNAYFHGVGSETYDRVIVPGMETLAGPVITNPDGTQAFKDQGALAPLTTRINTGETVSLFGSAGATVPTPVPALGVTLDAGAQIALGRVEGPNGSTRIELRLSGNVQAGGELNATGQGTRASGGDTQLAGVAGATLNASASVGADGSATFSFDPTNAQDMATLAGLTASLGGAAAGQMIMPGPGGAALGAMLLGGADGRAAMKAAPDHLTEMEGAISLRASATASVSLGANLQRREGTADRPGPRALNAAEKSMLERASGQLLQATASAEGQARIGIRSNRATGETTTFVALSGSAEASATLAGANAGGSTAGNVTLNVITDRNGNSRVQVVRDLTREDFRGWRTSIESAAGRPITPGMAAMIGESDTVRVTADLSPDVARRVMAGDAGAIAQALDMTGKAYSVPANGVVAIHREQRSISFAQQFGQVGARAAVGMANEQQTTLFNSGRR